MNKVFGFIILIIIVVAIWIFSQDNNDSQTMEVGDSMMENNIDGTAMEGIDESVIMKRNLVLAGSSSLLLDFTKLDYEEAVASDKLVVLYFYANWCPLCKEEFPKMQSAFDAILGDGVVGFRVNYKDSDTDSDETELAKQFGIAYQHTKVFLKDGKQILKSPESWDEARYETEIAKVIK